MAKKTAKPSSIRLTPAADAWILKWVKATDLSMSSLINQAIGIAALAMNDDVCGVYDMCDELRMLATLRQIDAAATAKKAEVREAAKGAK